MTNRNLLMSLVLSCALLFIGVIGFAQSITVQDNGPATPTTSVRSFADSVLPTTTTVTVSTDSATTTEDIARINRNYSVYMVKFAEVATTAALLEPTIPGILTFQFNTDNGKLYMRLMEADGTTWGAVATLTDDLTSALN